MSAAKFECQEEQAVPESTSSRAWRYLKIAVPVAVGFGAVAACFLFPPAAILIAPAVEFLMLNVIPAAVTAYVGSIGSGFIALGLIATGIALATVLLMSVTAGVFNAIAKCCSKKPKAEEKAINAANNDQAVQFNPANKPDTHRGCCHRSPVGSNVEAAKPATKQELEMGM